MVYTPTDFHVDRTSGTYLGDPGGGWGARFGGGEWVTHGSL